VKCSELFATISKESVSDTNCRSEEIAIKAGLIHSYGSGTFGYTHLGKKVLDNIEEVVREEMDKTAQEVRMNLLQTSKLWKESGRWKNFEGEEFFHFQNRDKKDFCLAATHEEAVTGMARKYVRSYRDLDFTVYQIGRKFRDDHARKGLLRAKEFTMKDAYSFHKTQEGLNQKFQEIVETYKQIFNRLGLNYFTASADTGSMGGSASKEFLAEAKVGSDTIQKCRNCNYATKNQQKTRCQECGAELEETNAIEIGHCFKLGTRYSDTMNLNYTTEKGKEKQVIMGCYGIGISRLIAAIIEQQNTGNTINWNKEVAAYNTAIITCRNEQEIQEKAENIYEKLQEKEEILFFDQNRSAGEKFAEADLLGTQQKIILGENLLEDGNIEIENRNGEKKELDSTEVIKELT
jgi:prolyl-tRNA synthetase